MLTTYDNSIPFLNPGNRPLSVDLKVIRKQKFHSWSSLNAVHQLTMKTYRQEINFGPIL